MFGLSPILSKGLEWAALGFALWYVYDYVFERPIREVSQAYEVKINELVTETTFKNEVIKIAGSKLSTALRELQECEDKEIVGELNGELRAIENMEETDVENIQNDTFNLYDYSF